MWRFNALEQKVEKDKFDLEVPCMVFIHLYMCFFKDDVKSLGHVSRWPNLGEVKSTFLWVKPRKKSIHIFLTCHLYLIFTLPPKNRCVFWISALPNTTGFRKKKPTKRFTAPVGTGRCEGLEPPGSTSGWKMTKFEAARAAHNATKAKLGCLRSRYLVAVMECLGTCRDDWKGLKSKHALHKTKSLHAMHDQCWFGVL